MECDAVLNTLMECLQYISFNVLDTQEGLSLLEKVMSEHVSKNILKFISYIHKLSNSKLSIEQHFIFYFYYFVPKK